MPYFIIGGVPHRHGRAADVAQAKGALGKVIHFHSFNFKFTDEQLKRMSVAAIPDDKVVPDHDQIRVCWDGVRDKAMESFSQPYTTTYRHGDYLFRGHFGDNGKLYKVDCDGIILWLDL